MEGMQPDTTNKKQIYGILAIIVALILVLFWLRGSGSDQTNTENSAPESQEQVTTPNSNPATGDSGSIEKTGSQLTITGTVVKSDNTKRGSYMVQTGTSNIYLAGTRDYGQFEGKKVRVNATGSIESFAIVSVEVIE